ncbi:acyl-CoA dehydrogenase family protein [Nocardia sp. NPDC050799]|uniref:acyl-CoA dehydrogenase family protein n=1 Tax=Nocardia sp. NPDC050799 TaxID=3154842 RepID=UPI0033EE9572
MFDFTPTEEQRDICAAVRTFVRKELAPLEGELIARERRGEPGQPTWDEMVELQEKARRNGLWGVDVPEEYGGVNFPATTLALINEELGYTPFDFRFGGNVPAFLYECTGGQIDEYLKPAIESRRKGCMALTETASGSDARRIRTTATKRGDDWVIRGEKAWITNGQWADFAIVIARAVVDGEDQGPTAFIVDREGGFTSRTEELMGSHHCATLNFDDVVVPNNKILGEVGGGFGLALHTIYRSRAYNLPARNIGASIRLLGVAIEYANTRVTFDRTLASRENIQYMIAESDVEIRAARGLVLQATTRADRGLEYRSEACAAKLFASKIANDVADRTMQIHGALGYSKETIIERFYRDLRIERIYEGADEMQLGAIARGLLSGKAAPGGGR